MQLNKLFGSHKVTSYALLKCLFSAIQITKINKLHGIIDIETQNIIGILP